MKNRNAQASTCHPQRMSNRDSSTVDVHNVAVQTQLVDAVLCLRAERLVDLIQVDVFLVQSRLFEKGRNSHRRANAHDRWVNSHDRIFLEGAQRRESSPCRLGSLHQHRHGGAIAQLRRVSRGRRAVLAKHGLEFAQRRGGHAHTDALVGGHSHRLNRHVALFVLELDLRGDGDDFVTLTAREKSIRATRVTQHSEPILALSRNPIALGDIFRGLSHAEIAIERLLHGLRPRVGLRVRRLESVLAHGFHATC
mmetsp:Transcript_21735/g.58018  ORF Transcript_21735/g.58018 Transcript_21735/m.58018 type:complete len:252 (-) Transcript_21735:228-983(-)